MKLECQLVMDVGTQFLRFYREAVEIENEETRAVLKRYIDESAYNFSRVTIRDPLERQKFVTWYNKKKVES